MPGAAASRSPTSRCTIATQPLLALVSWFVILFTGKLPDSLAGWQNLYVRYTNRATTYADFLREMSGAS